MKDKWRGWVVNGLVGVLLSIFVVGGVGTLVPFKLLDIEPVVFKLAESSCRPNDGLQLVQVFGTPGKRRYTFVCQNTARFLDVEIDVRQEVPDHPVTAKEVLK